MDIQNIILIFEAILLFLLAFYVLFRNPKQAISVSFFVMVFGASIWVFTNGTDYVYRNTTLTILTYLGAILIAIGFFYFSYYFPYRHKTINKIIGFLVIVVGLFMAGTLFTNNLFFKSITYNDNITDIQSGPIFHLFNIYFLIIWIWGINNFIQKYKRSDGLHRWQIKNVFWAFIVSFIAGVTTNLLLPWIFNIWEYGHIGPMFSIVFFGFLSYILFKKEV